MTFEINGKSAAASSSSQKDSESELPLVSRVRSVIKSSIPLSKVGKKCLQLRAQSASLLLKVLGAAILTLLLCA